MLHREVPLAAILPIERCINAIIVERYQWELEQGRQLQPSLLVPLYPDVLDRDLIAVDGHHRACARHLIGSLVAPCIIYTEDEEIMEATAPALAPLGTLDSVRHEYRERWQVNVAGAGLAGAAITSLPSYRKPLLPSWRPALACSDQRSSIAPGGS